MSSTARRIIGIDPGSRITGYGIVDFGPGRLDYVASGCIRPAAEHFPERLGEIYRGIETLIDTHQPQLLAIEDVFLARNPSSALKLGQARGVAIAAAVSRALPIHEYAARRVKLAVAGTGRATKEQIQHMVKVMLRLPRAPAADAADALAIAICHVNTSGP